MKEDADEMEIVINEEGCKRKMKSEFKREIKKKIQKKMISKLKSLETTELRTVAIEGFGKKNYMSGMFNGTEVSEVLKVKLQQRGGPSRVQILLWGG